MSQFKISILNLVSMKPMRLDREGLKLRFCGREKMPSKNVYVGGEGVLTESDLKKLEQKIKEQENKIKKLKKQRIYFVAIGAILSWLIRTFLW